MVKIPGFDELKKMGTDLIDSAKTVKLSGVVDKFKSGKSVDIASGQDRLSHLLNEMNTTLNELNAAQAAESSLIKRLQDHLREIAKLVGPESAPATTETPANAALKEDNKP